MIRYYAFATVFVLVVAILATAWWDRDWLRLKIASVHVEASPPGISFQHSIGQTSQKPFIAVAPWALSAVPECLLQRRLVQGDVAYVRAHLPPLTPLGVGQSIRVADCTMTVTKNGIDLVRGVDKMHIPAPTDLYRQGQRLWLYETTQGVPLLRSYDARAPIL